MAEAGLVQLRSTRIMQAMPPEWLGKLCLRLAMVPTQPSLGRSKPRMAAAHYTMREDQHGRALLAGPETFRANAAVWESAGDGG